MWPFLTWWTTHFVITDRRVMFRHGLLTRTGIDIPLARINSVEFRHGLMDRMLRTGTLIIESASQDPLEFYDIPRVEQVHSLLYHEVFDTLGVARNRPADVVRQSARRRRERRSGVTLDSFVRLVPSSSSNTSAIPPPVSADSAPLGLRPNSSGNTQRRNAQNRNAICSRLPMM